MSDSIPTELGRWFDAYAGRLVFYARQWLESAAAEDVVQEAFIALASQRPSPNNVAAWLFTAVRNGAISAARSSQRRGRREREAVSAHRAWFELDVGDALDATAAERALIGLPPEQREIILLRIWGGLSLIEAAAVIGGTPVSTLFSRYKAGLAALRQMMEPSCRNQTT